MIRGDDRIESIWKEPSDVDFGSYGLDQCIDLVERRSQSGRGPPKPEGEDWLEGTGIALAMLECGPPTEHRSGAEMRLLPDGSYHLAVGSTEMGNGSTTSHRQIAAAVLGTRASRIAIINADTDLTPYDTGTFASTGTVVAGQAVELHCDGAARQHPRLMPAAISVATCRMPSCKTMWSSAPTGSIRSPNSMRLEPKRAIASTCRRKAYLSPRSVAFNVHGVRVAVHRVTGEIMTLQSVHARRHRQADQPDAVPRPDRRRHRHGLRLGAHREDGL